MKKEGVMADISFTCPHCKQHLDAPPEMAGDKLACPTCQKQIQVPMLEPVKLIAKRESLAGRLVAGIAGGFILSMIAVNICTVILYDPMVKEPSTATKAFSVIIFFVLWAVAIVVAVKAERAAKAWRRILISNACLSFAMPLSAFIMAGKAAHQFETKGHQLEAAAVAGAGGIMAIVLGVVGLFLGAIFLVVGLLVGRDKKDNNT